MKVRRAAAARKRRRAVGWLLFAVLIAGGLAGRWFAGVGPCEPRVMGVTTVARCGEIAGADPHRRLAGRRPR